MGILDQKRGQLEEPEPNMKFCFQSLLPQEDAKQLVLPEASPLTKDNTAERNNNTRATRKLLTIHPLIREDLKCQKIYAMCITSKGKPLSRRKQK